MILQTCVTKPTCRSWTIEYETHMYVFLPPSKATANLLLPQLYSLYLIPPNFNAVAFPLYIAPSTTSTLVRLSLAHQLRTAAEGELSKQSVRIDAESIYQGSDKAFGALSELLGDEDYYFGERKPGLFDASVFAYTNVILDEGLDWKDSRMVEGLLIYSNLVDHRQRILEAYFRNEH